MSARRLDEAAELLRVLAHPVRLRLLELLGRKEFSVGQLAAHLKQQPHVISQHLSQLRLHGVLKRAREGRTVRYRLVSQIAAKVLRCIE